MDSGGYDIDRGCHRLHVTPLDGGGQYYTLYSDMCRGNGLVLLCFSITREGYLIGDGRDMQTAERAKRLTGRWA